MKTTAPARSIIVERHYEFGRNWQRFSKVIDEKRISVAMRSLTEMLEVDDLSGARFLDVGAGSGLFSLAACRLGAEVCSFDCDSESVACAREVKRRYLPDTSRWVIGQGSVLERDYLAALGTFDFVYAWGVLHHTGALWDALENILVPLRADGKLYIALYNDQGRVSDYWRWVKRLYSHNASMRAPITCAHLPFLAATRLLPRMLNGRLKSDRGMSLWHDLADWLGGYPFEVAKPQDIIRFYEEHGCSLLRFRRGGDPSGNNEYVFRVHP